MALRSLFLCPCFISRFFSTMLFLLLSFVLIGQPVFYWSSNLLLCFLAQEFLHSIFFRLPCWIDSRISCLNVFIALSFWSLPFLGGYPRAMQVQVRVFYSVVPISFFVDLCLGRSIIWLSFSRMDLRRCQVQVFVHCKIRIRCHKHSLEIPLLLWLWQSSKYLFCRVMPVINQF